MSSAKAIFVSTHSDEKEAFLASLTIHICYIKMLKIPCQHFLVTDVALKLYIVPYILSNTYSLTESLILLISLELAVRAFVLHNGVFCRPEFLFVLSTNGLINLLI